MKASRPCLAFAAALIVLASALGFGGCRSACPASAKAPVRILLVVGGHGFDTNQFYQMFQSMPGVSLEVAEHPNAQRLWSAEASRAWDVLVLYDLYQPISEEARANLLARLGEGKGLVALHHAIANYQAWPEYEQIIGARYYLAKTNRHGVEKLRSQFQHDVDFRVHVADPRHPVARGVSDFAIHDETYRLFDVAPSVDVLLTTQAPTSGPQIGWAKNYGKARVVYLQLGHDRQAYANPSYKQLVHQAILWTARRPGAKP